MNGARTVTITESIAPGHKFAIPPISQGEDVVKFSAPIGHATSGIQADGWIHSHNLATNLGPDLTYDYHPKPGTTGPGTPTRTFERYVRVNGNVGIRDDLYIVPTVGCINSLCQSIADQFQREHPDDSPFTSVIVTRHPYGCSQLSGDLVMTQRICATSSAIRMQAESWS